MHEEKWVLVLGPCKTVSKPAMRRPEKSRAPQKFYGNDVEDLLGYLEPM
jgi:hypothetical protein